jgi:hypothetical protein
MWFLIIVIISLSIGIWKYPFIKYHARKSGAGSVGCGDCDECKCCGFAIVGTITAIVTVPSMLLWIYVLKPMGIKIFLWQKERTKVYTKTKQEKE